MNFILRLCTVLWCFWQVAGAPGEIDKWKHIRKQKRPPRPQITATQSNASSTSTGRHPRPSRPYHHRPSHSDPQRQETTVKYQPGCRLERPSLKDWNSGTNSSVIEWVTRQFEEYFDYSDYSGFHLYMRDTYAPDLVSSQFVCQGIGACSIVDCKQITENISSHDRQMAYYAFEAIANVDLVAKMVKDAVDDAASDIQNRDWELVDRFTWTRKTREKALSEARAHKVVGAAMTAILLVAMGTLGALGNPVLGSALGIGKAGTDAISAVGNGISFVGNSFIGLSGLADKLGPADPNFEQEARDHFRRSWNMIATQAEKKIREDAEAYMNGNMGMTPNNMNIVDLIRSGEFVEVAPGLNNDLHELVQKWFTAVAIDGLWSTEPVYILDTRINTYSSSCEEDPRGPVRNKVCLPERAGHVYWLYSMLEATRDIASPPGLKALLTSPERYSNITKEDIVRSSLWVAENKLEEVLRPYDVTTVPGGDQLLYANSTENAGSLPGAFTVPICRNPGGEAISSVWSKEGRNYPCRCGNVNWIYENWKRGLEESQFFYEQTGFYASTEFENQCQHQMGCKGKGSHHWKFNIPKGYPPKAEGMKHVWKKCKHVHGHTTVGNPNQDQ
ncbi:hypothetical protein P171DRAFT_505745 [Karstenula rhodostoma CBS 690.94]|uniref:Uncharacterized protein n=1 Tax=Karstenula rhodostoma CBS 690.94 TaxID=1392251 RepID=A0A9P4P673_9PLEO|nr:hypothetical protein P171DRAFT_505745 [Karstenula rhodostoma CBS 690.94]